MGNKMGNYKLKSTVASLAALVIALAGCGPKEATDAGTDQEAVVVRIAYRPKAIADVTPVVIKEAQLADRKITVDLVAVSSPPDALQKLSAGEVDCIAGLPMEPIFQQMATKDVGLRAYGFQVDEPGNGWASLVGSKKNGIRTIKDLAGKTVAALPTSQAQFFMKKILEASGIPERQIKIVTYNPQSPLLGLRSGEHSAILGLDPAISLAISEGNPVLAKAPISTLLYKGRQFPLTASLYSTRFATAHPEALAEFKKAVDKAIQFTKENPDQVKAFLTKESYGGFDAALVQRFSLPNMILPNKDMHAITIEFVDDLVRDGQLKQKIDVEPLFQATGG